MRILDRYILRSHFGPFAFGFFVTTGVLFTEVLKNFLDDFLAKGVSPITIAEVLLLSLGHTVALSVPMAVLVATLLAFGQMAQDHELTALKASGMSLYRIMAPVFLAATLLCITMILFNNYVLPESNHRLAGLISDIGRKRPTVSILPGIFIDDFEGYKLYIGDKKEDSDEIFNVIVHVEKQRRPPDIAVAPRGRLYFGDSGQTLYIELYDGEMHSVPDAGDPEEALYRVTRFDSETVVIPEVGERLQRTNRKYRSDREMNITMMRNSVADRRQRIVKLRERLDVQCRKRMENRLAMLEVAPDGDRPSLQPSVRPGRLIAGAETRLRDTARIERSAIDSYERQIRSLQVEIQKKFSIPAACIVFVLIGAPLAIRSGRSGMTMAIAFSIGCFTVYYLFLTGGEKLADRQLLSPFLAMWAANIVFGSLGIMLTWRSVSDSSTFNYRRLNPITWRRRSRAASSDEGSSAVPDAAAARRPAGAADPAPGTQRLDSTSTKNM
jgi:lipopolysaccharide export system permease protein